MLCNHIGKPRWCRLQDSGGLTVEIWINPLVHFINFRSELLWIQVNSSLIGRDKVVECCIEDANNLRRFIIDDGVELLIPEDRD